MNHQHSMVSRGELEEFVSETRMWGYLKYSAEVDHFPIEIYHICRQYLGICK